MKTTVEKKHSLKFIKIDTITTMGRAEAVFRHGVYRQPLLFLQYYPAGTSPATLYRNKGKRRDYQDSLP